ncbi:hypothetical protein BZA77DRAFT_356055 [Pyronema omphalodes]|nr:hypothetical protein BZA77DRAFT_356055 [Pyronema omphalodes]
MSISHLLVTITAIVGLVSATPNPQRKYGRISDVAKPEPAAAVLLQPVLVKSMVSAISMVVAGMLRVKS